MELERYLKELRSVRGYIASSILTWTGDAIASDIVDPSINASLLATMCNDAFNSAHECVEKLGGGECLETVISMPVGTILLRCSGKASKSHIHVGCILAKNGNSALARMMIDKIAKQVAPLLG
jgi:predicted regulator of Ras-like GTPase activity (Roadblock/LC7/MglB family)